MPRAIWSGAISFGLVNVPVKLFSAVQDHDLRFHLYHRKDDSRIGLEKVCKKEGKEVPSDEIAKAYESGDGKLVYLDDEDFEAAQATGYHVIELTDFVPYEQIDPIYYEHTYHVGPEERAERVYALLARTLDRSGLVGLGTFVMRDRQYLGCLRVRDGLITLEQMRFADEVRDVDELRPKNVKVEGRELDLALDLVDRLAGDFDPTKYTDTYRDALMKVIEQKRKGKQVKVPKHESPAVPDDLMAALQESLERHRSGKGKANGKPRAGSLESLPKDELLQRAAKKGVSGRSKMSKHELVAALR